MRGAYRVGLMLVAALSGGIQQLPAQESSRADRNTVRAIRLEAFVRNDLPAAAQVNAFADDLRQRVPGLEIVVHDVLADREQLLRLHELTKKFGRSKAVVPSFYCCNRMYFGFANAEKNDADIARLRTVDVYTRTTCQRCQAAKVFIAQLKVRWPALRFQIHDVDADRHARQTWEQLCRDAGQLPGLPTINFAGHVMIGYQSDDVSGANFERLIEKYAGSHTPVAPQPAAGEPAAGEPPRAQPSAVDATRLVFPLLSNFALLSAPPGPREAGQVDTVEQAGETSPLDDELLLPSGAEESDMGEGMLTAPAEDSKSDLGSIRLPFFGTIRVSDMGLPAFTLAVGLVDGFNPCAMWVLIFLLSVLVNIRDRWRIVAIAGTFVVVSGLAYFAFMAAWLNLFLLIGIARPVQIVLGVLAGIIGVINIKDFVAFKRGISLSIPEASKPGLYRRVRQIVSAKYMTAALVGAVGLAIVVNMIELLCTAGLPALYTQILAVQQLPAWENYLFLGLYISAYMFDDSLLLGAVVITLSHRKLQEREGQWLKLISGVVILVLGLIMIFRPSWLQLAH